MNKLLKKIKNIFFSRLLGHFSAAVLCYTLFLFLQLGSFNFNVPLANSLEDIPQEFSQQDLAQIAANFRSNNSRLIRSNTTNNRNKKLFSITSYASLPSSNILSLPLASNFVSKIYDSYFHSNILLKSIPIRAGPIVC